MTDLEAFNVLIIVSGFLLYIFHTLRERYLNKQLNKIEEIVELPEDIPKNVVFLDAFRKRKKKHK